MTHINSVFANNLGIFAERFASLATRLGEVPAGLIQAAATDDGSYCYVKQLENGQWQTLSLIERPLEAAAKAVSAVEDRLTSGSGPVVVVGLNPGYVLDIIYQHFQKEYYQRNIPRRIYVIVDSIECLYGWLQKADRRELLQRQEIEFYWHEDVEEIVGLCESDQSRSHLFIPISSYPEAKASARIAPLGRFFMGRQDEEKRLFRQNRKYYDSISDDELNEIMSGKGSRKPRMLIPSHGSSTVVQYSVRDTAALFEKEGWEVRIMHMKTDLSRWRVNQNISDFKPDVYLLVNHLRTEKTSFYPDNMMFITWIQDTVSSINNSKSAESWNEHVNGKEKQRDRIIGYVGQIKPYGYLEDRLEECPMIVNEDIFKPRKLTEVELQKYSCDVCFASNRSTPTDVVAKELAEKLGEFGFDEGVMVLIHDHLWEYYRAEQTCTSYVTLERKVCELPEVNEIFTALTDKDDHDFVIQRIFWELNDIIYRHIVLEWIDDMADVNLHLYGKGWENHPRFAKYSKGVLEHGEELSKAYQTAKWCVHLNSMEGNHQRFEEIKKSNGRLISRTIYTDKQINFYSQFLKSKQEASIEGNNSFDADLMYTFSKDIYKFSQEKEKYFSKFKIHLDKIIKKEFIASIANSTFRQKNNLHKLLHSSNHTASSPASFTTQKSSAKDIFKQAILSHLSPQKNEFPENFIDFTYSLMSGRIDFHSSRFTDLENRLIKVAIKNTPKKPSNIIPDQCSSKLRQSHEYINYLEYCIALDKPINSVSSLPDHYRQSILNFYTYNAEAHDFFFKIAILLMNDPLWYSYAKKDIENKRLTLNSAGRLCALSVKSSNELIVINDVIKNIENFIVSGEMDFVSVLSLFSQIVKLKGPLELQNLINKIAHLFSTDFLKSAQISALAENNIKSDDISQSFLQQTSSCWYSSYMHILCEDKVREPEKKHLSQLLKLSKSLFDRKRETESLKLIELVSRYTELPIYHRLIYVNMLANTNLPQAIAVLKETPTKDWSPKCEILLQFFQTIMGSGVELNKLIKTKNINVNLIASVISLENKNSKQGLHFLPDLCHIKSDFIWMAIAHLLLKKYDDAKYWLKQVSESLYDSVMTKETLNIEGIIDSVWGELRSQPERIIYRNYMLNRLLNLELNMTDIRSLILDSPRLSQ